MKIIFWSGTKSLGPAQYVNKCLVRQKKFGPAQNNLGPVEGQGNSKFIFCASTKYFGVALNAIQFLVLHKKNWTSTKYFRTCT